MNVHLSPFPESSIVILRLPSFFSVTGSMSFHRDSHGHFTFYLKQMGG